MPCFDEHVAADHDQHRGAGLADEEVDGRCLPLAPLLADQAHAGIVAGELGHDLGCSILAATRHDDELRNLSRGEPLFENALDGIADVGFLVVGHDAHAAGQLPVIRKLPLGRGSIPLHYRHRGHPRIRAFQRCYMFIPQIPQSGRSAGGSQACRRIARRAIWRTLCSTRPPRSARSSIALACASTRKGGVDAEAASPCRRLIPARSP